MIRFGAMEEINKQLCTQAFRGQFVTMLLMVVNPKDGAVEIAAPRGNLSAAAGDERGV